MFTITVLHDDTRLDIRPGAVHDDTRLGIRPGTVDEPDGVGESEPRRSSYARCSDGHGTLAHLFFSDDDHDLARAKAICRSCGLAEGCLSEAIGRQEPYGIWGGKLVLDGIAVEVKRKRGRPPKTPRPVLVVDEVPLPPHLVA